MDRKARGLGGLGIALTIPALCFVAFSPDRPKVIDRQFDVTTRDQLETSCRQTTDAESSAASSLEDPSGRWFSEGPWGHDPEPLLAYRVSLQLETAGHDHPPSRLPELLVNSWACEFRTDTRGNLRLKVSGSRTSRDVEKLIRAIGTWAFATPEGLDTTIREFESGVGLDLDDARADGSGRLRLEVPGLTLLFTFDDFDAARWGHASSRSEPPRDAPPDEPRYAVSVWFVPQT